MNLSQPKLGPNAERYVLEALAENQLSQGRFNEEFEEGFANLVGGNWGVSCSNGTMALYIALKALGIGPGDKVIVPVLTFTATADAVVMAGAIPVFVDINESWCIDPFQVKKKIEGVKAIIAVHLYGMKADIQTLKMFNIPIIEDSAEYLGRLEGDIACYSLFGNKIMTTGEGGMCITDSSMLASIMRKARNHGRVTGYMPEFCGTNARLTNIQAAIGVSQLEDLPMLLAERTRVCEIYKTLVPKYIKSRTPWFFVALDQPVKGSRKGFLPLTQSQAYLSDERFPVAERLAPRASLLPTYPDLTIDEIYTFLGVPYNSEAIYK